MSARKILLLYAGPGYQGKYYYYNGVSTGKKNYFEQSDIPNVMNTGATEYLILTAMQFNYPKANDKVVWKPWVKGPENRIPDSVFGTSDSNSIETIRNDMLLAIDKYDNDHSAAGDSSVYTYKKYIENSISLAKLLRNHNSTVKLWFGLPTILNYPTSTSGNSRANFQPAARIYDYYYKTYYYDVLKQSLQNEGMWGNVEGIYYGTEDVVSWYTKFNTSAVSTQFNNVVVQNMKYMSDIVHGDGKKFLWIPYYLNTSETISRIGYIANKTNIFDIVILQPGYYQHTTNGGVNTYPNLEAINSSVSSQKVKNLSYAVVGGTKTSTTEIGFEMEVDAKVVLASNSSSYQSRYNAYVTKYNNYITGSTKRACAFYAGSPGEFKYPEVYNRVKNFFKFGTNSTT